MIAAASPYLATSWKPKSGTLLVCVGCGHTEVFANSIEHNRTLPGATEVSAGPAAPYR